ncbi:MAG: hypothetical protein KKA10_05910 [Euryarchaeota archaeon]|nr:hypothetical protein [Euryarchaeota archaeon]MCG2736314.1 hypothetical protein [Candidatus Methanoperedenaceae archaeon]
MRLEDQPFVDYIEKILLAYNIEPIGTVGRYSASPENPVVLMKKNIPYADFVVICATPRYLQKDLHTGQVSYGLSEMIHIETGIAYANNKPVVVFVREGTDVGNFIPNITQYITLNGKSEDFAVKKPLIYALLNSAYLLTKEMKNKMKESKVLNTAGKVVVVGLAIYGTYKLIKEIFGEK